MRVAYFSPLPPDRTGIADYSAALLPALNRLADVDAFVDDPDRTVGTLGWPRHAPTGAVERAPVQAILPTQHYPARRHRYDVALYQMGNSHFHEHIFGTLRRYPGVTVMHDVVLHHLMVEISLARGDTLAYLREMAYSHGLAGLEAARAVRHGTPPAFFEYPLVGRVLDTSLAILVHSHYAAGLLAPLTTTPIQVIPQPAVLVAQERAEARAALELDPDQLLVVIPGQVIPEKRVDVALAAVARLLARYPTLHVAVVGGISSWYGEFLPKARGLGLGDHLTITGHVDDALLDTYLAAADALITLRDPTTGETSAALLRGISGGAPVIVSDRGWYAELPDTICLKVGETTPEAVAHALNTLLEDQPRRAEMGAAARRFAHDHHSPDVAARVILDMLEAGQASRWSFEGENTP